MKFFKPEDFAGSTEMIGLISWEEAASIANEMIEWKGKVVYANNLEIENAWTVGSYGARLKALLICIEPISPPCTHPSDKIKASLLNVFRDDSDLEKYCFRCKCGAKVKPTAFEEIDDA